MVHGREAWRVQGGSAARPISSCPTWPPTRSAIPRLITSTMGLVEAALGSPPTSRFGALLPPVLPCADAICRRARAPFTAVKHAKPPASRGFVEWYVVAGFGGDSWGLGWGPGHLFLPNPKPQSLTPRRAPRRRLQRLITDRPRSTWSPAGPVPVALGRASSKLRASSAGRRAFASRATPVSVTACATGPGRRPRANMRSWNGSGLPAAPRLT